MMRWDPSRDLMSLRQAMDRLFEESVVRPSRFVFELASGIIPIDMFQTENDVVVKAPLPGVKPEAVDISISGDTLVIKAEQRQEKQIAEKDYFHKENRYGSVSRSVTLPVEVAADKAQANFENGVLTLTIPKSEKTKPKQIKVQVKGEATGKS